MADTHINAFFADVDAAKVEVQQAQAKLADAEARLEVKKKEVGYVESEVTETSEPEKPKKPLPNLDASEGYKKVGWKK